MVTRRIKSGNMARRSDEKMVIGFITDDGSVLAQQCNSRAFRRKYSK